MPGDREETLSEANLLGESSFGNFWAGSGLKTLMRMVDENREDMLQVVQIKTDTGYDISIESFLDAIAHLKILWS